MSNGWCSVPKGWRRITKGSELPHSAEKQPVCCLRLPACASEAESGWELPAARSAWPRRADGWLTSWGALREEVPEKKQKPGCPAPAALCPQPPAPPRPLPKRPDVSAQLAKEYICFSLKQLDAISIYIQMTAIQRERLFGWELGVPWITTLFAVSAYLCYIIPVKIPAAGIFCMAVKTSGASQANAVSLFRAQAAEVFRLQHTAPRERGEDGDIFPLKLQTRSSCSRKQGMKQGSSRTVQLSLGPTQPERNLVHSALGQHLPPLHLHRSAAKLHQFTRWKQRQELLPSAEHKPRRSLHLYAALHSRFGKLHNLCGSFFTCKLRCSAQQRCKLSSPFNWGLPPPGTRSQNPGGISARRPLNTHWNHMVFSPSAASDQTSPCNINAYIFLQKPRPCCTAQEPARNSLLNPQTCLLFLAARTLGQQNKNKLLHITRCLYTAHIFFSAQIIKKKTNPANRSDTEVLMILGPASEGFVFLISQSTGSLPRQTPAHRAKTSWTAKGKWDRTPHSSSRRYIKDDLWTVIWFDFCRTEWTVCVCPMTNPVSPWDAAGGAWGGICSPSSAQARRATVQPQTEPPQKYSSGVSWWRVRFLAGSARDRRRRGLSSVVAVQTHAELPYPPHRALWKGCG